MICQEQQTGMYGFPIVKVTMVGFTYIQLGIPMSNHTNTNKENRCFQRV